MADLTWKVSDITYCGGNGSGGWVNVSPSSGFVDENTTLTISVKQSSGGTGDCSAATITISASTGDIQEIPVKRCLRECNCNSIKFTATTTSTTDYTAKRIEIGKYSQDCQVCVEKAKVETDNTVLKNPTMSNGHIYADVTKNEGCRVRNGSYKFICKDEICLSGTISQTRYINSCESTDDSKVGVSFAGGGTGKTVDYNSHSLNFNISYGDSCWGLTSSATSAAWMTLNGNTVTVGEYSDTSNNRTGTITLNFKSSTPCGGDKTCTKTLSITQEKKPKPECNCDNLTVTGITNIVAEGGNNITIGSISMDSCMSNPRATSTASWISGISVSGNNIKANVSSNVKETETSDRTATVTVVVDKDGGTCSNDMTIKQKGYTPAPTPTCSIEGADIIDSCSGGTEQYEIKTS